MPHAADPPQCQKDPLPEVVYLLSESLCLLLHLGYVTQLGKAQRMLNRHSQNSGFRLSAGGQCECEVSSPCQ